MPVAACAPREEEFFWTSRRPRDDVAPFSDIGEKDGCDWGHIIALKSQPAKCPVRTQQESTSVGVDGVRTRKKRSYFPSGATFSSSSSACSPAGDPGSSYSPSVHPSGGISIQATWPLAFSGPEPTGIVQTRKAVSSQTAEQPDKRSGLWGDLYPGMQGRRSVGFPHRDVSGASYANLRRNLSPEPRLCHVVWLERDAARSDRDQRTG